MSTTSSSVSSRDVAAKPKETLYESLLRLHEDESTVFGGRTVSRAFTVATEDDRKLPAKPSPPRDTSAWQHLYEEASRAETGQSGLYEEPHHARSSSDDAVSGDRTDEIPLYEEPQRRSSSDIARHPPHGDYYHDRPRHEDNRPPHNVHDGTKRSPPRHAYADESSVASRSSRGSRPQRVHYDEKYNEKYVYEEPSEKRVHSEGRPHAQDYPQAHHRVKSVGRPRVHTDEYYYAHQQPHTTMSIRGGRSAAPTRALHEQYYAGKSHPHMYQEPPPSHATGTGRSRSYYDHAPPPHPFNDSASVGGQHHVHYPDYMYDDDDNMTAPPDYASPAFARRRRPPDPDGDCHVSLPGDLAPPHLERGRLIYTPSSGSSGRSYIGSPTTPTKNVQRARSHGDLPAPPFVERKQMPNAQQSSDYRQSHHERDSVFRSITEKKPMSPRRSTSYPSRAVTEMPPPLDKTSSFYKSALQAAGLPTLSTTHDVSADEELARELSHTLELEEAHRRAKTCEAPPTDPSQLKIWEAIKKEAEEKRLQSALEESSRRGGGSVSGHSRKTTPPRHDKSPPSSSAQSDYLHAQQLARAEERPSEKADYLRAQELAMKTKRSPPPNDYLLSQQLALEEWRQSQKKSGKKQDAHHVSMEYYTPSPGAVPSTSPLGAAKKRPLSPEEERLLRAGNLETREAIAAGQAHVVQCKGCFGRLHAPMSYALVYCPQCHTVSPGQPYHGDDDDWRSNNKKK